MGLLRKASRALALCAVLFYVLLLVGCGFGGLQKSVVSADSPSAEDAFKLEDVPPYTGSPSVEVHGNVPYFTDDDRARGPFELYSPLDSLGRCGVAFALVGKETMPTCERGSIGMVKPSGWRISKYPWIDGEYLFNRCHLIAFSLAGENDNELNLITGTRTMNAVGMLAYEEKVARYIDTTGNHVLYRATPVFDGDNLVASGVLMEAESIEDGGSGIRFCAWCYNAEPGVTIDYATGDNHAETSRTLPLGNGDGQAASEGSDLAGSTEQVQTYILNTNTHRFHYPECPSVNDMAEKNKRVFEGTRDQAIDDGYKPCGVCKP